MTRLFTSIAEALAAGVLIALAGAATAQQAYPNKPLRFITPYAPGGQTTVLGRLIGQALTESMGQPVIIDSRPGGNTIIGTEALFRSSPDGHTIMLMTPTHVTLPHLYQNLPFDAIRDFAPVATIFKNETILVLHPSAPASNLRELIALAKSKPGQINYSSLGIGGMQHIQCELFNQAAGITAQAIAYKGAGPAIADLVAGQVMFSIQSISTVIPHIKSGKLKAFAITGEARLAVLPQVPTFSEAGLPGYNEKSWVGVIAPAGTPRAITEKLSTEIARILAMPNMRERLYSQGVEPFISTPAQFAALLKADLARYGKIIKTANIKLEN